MRFNFDSKNLSRAAILVAASCALNACGVLLVGGATTGAAVIHDRRTVGTVAEDKGIEYKAGKILSSDPKWEKRTNIDVTSYNRTVLLTGQTDSPELGRLFAQEVSRIENVKRVVNELTIGQSGSASERTHDAYLTSKAKLVLFQIKLPTFDPLRIKVTTQKGSVYLLGLVTPEEARQATERIRYINGVKRVVKVFEYIEQ